MSKEPVQYIHKQLFRWNIDDDAYKPSIAVYENGVVEIVVGGRGIGTSIERIFDSMFQPKEHLCWKEIDRLKDAIQTLNGSFLMAEASEQKAQMEVEKLKAQNEKMREALEEIAGGVDYYEEPHEAQFIAEKALKGV